MTALSVYKVHRISFEFINFSGTMAKVPCNCGCGQMVTYTTGQNHLRGRGTTALRARVLAENELLRGIPRQRKGQQPRQNHTKPSRKRSSSNADQASSCKRLKTSQLEVTPDPDNLPTFQAETDQVDPFPAVVMKPSKLVERTKHAMEQRWEPRRENDGKLGDNFEFEENEVEDGDNNEDGDDEAEDDTEDEDDNEDGDNEEEDDGEDGDDDEDEDDGDPNLPGFSNWDLLGEEFEREAAALGLSSSCKSHIRLMIL